MNWLREVLLRVARSERTYFWLREALHFFGGSIVGIFTIFFYSYWVTFACWAALMTVIIWKEIKEDKVSQPRYKTVSDCVAWTLGFWAVSWVKFV